MDTSKIRALNMSMNPVISVVMPTYNRAHLISRAIHSVLNQTYENLELIIVDDGSTDNTEQVVQSFNDTRLKYIKQPKNSGAAAARNTGIEAALGAYIAFLDSDDEWLPHKLEKQVKAFSVAPPEVGVVYSGIWWLEDGKTKYFSYPNNIKKDGYLRHSILKKGFIFLQSSVVKRECFSKAGMFDERLVVLEDWELWLRISYYCHFRCIDEPLACVYSTAGTLAKNYGSIMKAREIILLKHWHDFENDRRQLSDDLLGIGSYLCANEQFNKGMYYLRRSVRENPLNILALIAVLVSLMGEDIFLKMLSIYRKIRYAGLWKKS